MKAIREVIVVRKTEAMKLSANISHMFRLSRSRSEQSGIEVLRFSKPASVGTSSLEKVKGDEERIL